MAQKYINTQTLEYPISSDQLKANHPEILFPRYLQPADIIDFNYAPVLENSPTYDPNTQIITEGQPANNPMAQTWEQTWTITAMAADQITAQVLAKQTALAAETAQATTQLVNAVTVAVQLRLDIFAQTRGYDNILSACTYANSTIAKFKTEGQYCVDTRDNTWNTCYLIMLEAEAGTTTITSVDDVLKQLSTPTWPN